MAVTTVLGFWNSNFLTVGEVGCVRACVRVRACDAPRMDQWQRQQFQKVCLHQGSLRSTEKTQTDEEWMVGQESPGVTASSRSEGHEGFLPWPESSVWSLDSGSIPVRSRDGSSLITDRQGILSRLAEQCSQSDINTLRGRSRVRKMKFLAFLIKNCAIPCT